MHTMVSRRRTLVVSRGASFIIANLINYTWLLNRMDFLRFLVVHNSKSDDALLLLY